MKVKIIVDWCVPVLALTPNKDFINEIRQAGCKGKFDWNNPVQYSNDLRAAITYSKKYKMQYQRKEKELEDIRERNKGKDFTMKWFEDMACTLGKYFSFNVDYDTITVSRFCSMWRQYDSYREVMNADVNNLLNKQNG